MTTKSPSDGDAYWAERYRAVAREHGALRDLAEAVRVFLETPGASTFALEQMMRKVEEVRR